MSTVAEPEQGEVPDSPVDLSARTWRYVLRRTWREFRRDQCLDQAAALTYYAVLSLFPALIALLAVVGLVRQGESTVSTIESTATELGIPGVEDVLTPALRGLGEAPAGPGLALLVSLATALWSASGYVGSLGRALNRIYETEEGRPFWKLRPILLGVTMALVLLAGAAVLTLGLSGPVARAIGEQLGLGETTVAVWNVVKWPLLGLCVVLAVTLLYWATPNIRPPGWRWLGLAATVAILLGVLASVVFGVYVDRASSYDRVYGTLSSVVVFLLWLWLVNGSLLFGAELGSELERGRQLQSGVRAEARLRLGPRDHAGIDKQLRQERQDVAEGRELRTEATGSDAPVDPDQARS